MIFSISVLAEDKNQIFAEDFPFFDGIHMMGLSYIQHCYGVKNI